MSWLVDHWQSQSSAPLVSRPTARELTRVLAYSKFRLSSEEQFEALGGYLPFCEVVQIAEYCPIQCRDPKDQIFLDLAESGHADLVVTGDEDLLVLAGQTRFAICSPELYATGTISPSSARPSDHRGDSNQQRQEAKRADHNHRKSGSFEVSVVRPNAVELEPPPNGHKRNCEHEEVVTDDPKEGKEGQKHYAQEYED
jgi:putative PIN family toxin of toxin-antitoxin system